MAKVTSKRITLEYEAWSRGRRVMVRVELGDGDTLDRTLKQVDLIVKKELERDE